MQKLQTEGIVVQTIPFKEYDRIVTLFTPHEGLIKLFIKGALRAKKGKGYGMEPLARIEVHCSEGRGDLYKCFESSVLDSHLALRASLEVLTAACEMLQTVAATQQPGKPAPSLFNLLTAYLLRLPSIHNPRILTSSFRLKTLRVEGLFTPHFYCTVCRTLLDGDSFHDEQGIYCTSHAPVEAIIFSNEERDLLLLLAFSKDFHILRELPLDNALYLKICRLFDYCRGVR